jgi:hypothetical protein
VEPLQQPLGHDAASQTHLPRDPLHSCPVPHVPQATPPFPQVVAVSPVWQWPVESQQPFGQVFASQTHFPCELHS